MDLHLKSLIAVRDRERSPSQGAASAPPILATRRPQYRFTTLAFTVRNLSQSHGASNARFVERSRSIAADDMTVLDEHKIVAQHELVIEPGRNERHYWLDLWRYRELFQVLAWRDISVRYKQTV